MKCILLISSVIIFFSCCKKSNESAPGNQATNFGTLKVTFASSTVYHTILVGLGLVGLYKSFPIGVTSKTLHVTPVPRFLRFFSYSLPGGPAVNTVNASVTIIQNNETFKSVSS